MHEIREILFPITVIGGFSMGLYYLTKILTEYFLKKKILDKDLAGPDIEPLLRRQAEESSKMSALKWALLIFFGGAGLIIIEFIELEANSTLPFGIFACTLSLGFLIYFIVANKLTQD